MGLNKYTVTYLSIGILNLNLCLPKRIIEFSFTVYFIIKWISITLSMYLKKKDKEKEENLNFTPPRVEIKLLWIHPFVV